MNKQLFLHGIGGPVQGLVVDLFAGGGGASTGIEQAIGRAVDIAINHDPAAIRMHEVNHPGRGGDGAREPTGSAEGDGMTQDADTISKVVRAYQELDDAKRRLYLEKRKVAALRRLVVSLQAGQPEHHRLADELMTLRSRP
jgi:site-specific DNA-cytosine methylase